MFGWNPSAGFSGPIGGGVAGGAGGGGGGGGDGGGGTTPSVPETAPSLLWPFPGLAQSEHLVPLWCPGRW